MWFPLYVDDFVGGTSTLTNDELGQYVRLLIAQWASRERQAIPEDKAEWLLRGPLSPDVRSKFDQVDLEGKSYLRNDRLAQEWAVAKEAHNKMSEAGSRGAESRWRDGPPNGHPISHPDGVASSPPLPQPQPQPQRTENNPQTTDSPPSGVLALKDAGLRIFEFWAAKVDKPRAQWNAKKKAMLRARWKELKGTPEEKEHLLKNVVDAAVHDPWFSGAESGTVYLDFENLFRNSERVEKLLGKFDEQKKGKGRKKTVTDRSRETIAAYRRPGE